MSLNSFKQNLDSITEADIILLRKIKQYGVDNSFDNLMDNSKGLDSWDNYLGEGSSWVVIKGIGRNRDAEDYDPSASNFEVALEMLGGEGKHVKVERKGHWGCGWFELIMVDPKNIKKLKIAYEISKALEDYPILDDSDFYEREHQYQTEFAASRRDDLAEALVEHFALPEECTEDTLFLEFCEHLNIECQRYFGNDTCINIYTSRQPDDSDFSRFEECVQLVAEYTESNEYVKFFTELFNFKDGV